jgi:protoporphyrinogen oxidase
MKQKLTIGIIGAGIGGLTAAALLIKQGYQITIFEKESRIGGRALSIDDFTQLTQKDYEALLSRFHVRIIHAEPPLEELFKKNLLQGYKLDLGYHAIGGGVLSTINKVLSDIGAPLDFIESHVGLIKENDWEFPFLTRLDKLKILPNILRLLHADEQQLQELDSISMTETINQYGKGKMKSILEIFSRSITTINNLDKISTGEMFRAQKNLYQGSKPVGYPINGLNSIHTTLSTYIKTNGGIIHLNTPVKKIQIEDNQATGIITQHHIHHFNSVVSNVPIQELFSIIDESSLPEWYIKSIHKLEATASVCAYYSLTQLEPDLLGKTFHFLEKNADIDGTDAVGMIDFMVTDPQVGIAPNGHYLVQAYIICTPKEAQNAETCQMLRKLIDKNLAKLIPLYKQQLLWVMYPVVSYLDGVAKSIDNIKPSIDTPIDHLYVIGDCVKAPGIGINCAINSSRILSKMLSDQ